MLKKVLVLMSIILVVVLILLGCSTELSQTPQKDDKLSESQQDNQMSIYRFNGEYFGFIIGTNIFKHEETGVKYFGFLMEHNNAVYNTNGQYVGMLDDKYVIAMPQLPKLPARPKPPVPPSPPRKENIPAISNSGSIDALKAY